MKRNLTAELLTVAIAAALAGGTAFAQSGGRGSTGSTPEQVGAASSSGGQSSSTRGTGSAATSATTSGGQGGGEAAKMAHDGIVRQGGQSFFVKEGRAQKIDHEMKLSEGITAEKDGKVTLKDGTELKLEDGKMVTLDGKVVDTPPEVSSTVGSATGGGGGATSGGTSGGTSGSSSGGGTSGSSTQLPANQ